MALEDEEAGKSERVFAGSSDLAMLSIGELQESPIVVVGLVLDE